ncbi:unnamed protein product [Cunninghamella echinulata]
MFFLALYNNKMEAPKKTNLLSILKPSKHRVAVMGQQDQSLQNGQKEKQYKKMSSSSTPSQSKSTTQFNAQLYADYLSMK